MRTNKSIRRSLLAAIATAAALAVVVGPGRADEAAAKKMAAPPPSSDPKIDFEKYTLDNGMEVILIPDNKTPVVFVSVWYHVGSGDETPGKSGFAHLFEHMMFQGTANTGEDKHFEILSNIGASGVNGTTNPNRTNYFEQVPSNQLETALWLESERMGYLLGSVTDKSLQNQIEVVRNERRQNYDTVPYRKSLFELYAAMYPEGHPYRYLTIGRHEDLERASLDDVKNFFKKWYVPANATLTLAGDFDVAEAKKLVEKWFGGFPKAAKPTTRDVAVPKLAKSQRVVVSDSLAKLRRVMWAWHTPALFAPGDAELDIVASALGNQGTGRLYKRLVVEKPLARSVSVGQGSMQRSSMFTITVDLNPDTDLAEVERIVEEELAKITKEPVSDREHKRAVVNFESMYVWGLESVGARAEQLQQCNHFTGKPDCLTWDLNRYRNSTPAKAREAAAQYLRPDARVVMIVMPGEGK